MNALIWVLVALSAGLLAGPMMGRGSHGRGWDVALGLTGSVVVSWLFQAARWDLPELGLAAVTVVAFLGAAGLIAAQRTIYPVCSWTPHMSPLWRADRQSDKRRDHGRRS
jgi:uncharacterized membrane protein YeaQ/YmgE (transglycosylase-associated protein family)